MGAALGICPARYSDVERIPLPEGLDLPPLDTQFESEEWLMENARAVFCPKTNEAIAVFGVKEIWPGVGHCFGFVTVHATEYKKTLILAARECMDIASQREMGFWRLQATVDSDYDRGIQYLIHLGFNIEGVMKMYGPDKRDHLMMARLIEWH